VPPPPPPVASCRVGDDPPPAPPPPVPPWSGVSGAGEARAVRARALALGPCRGFPAAVAAATDRPTVYGVAIRKSHNNKHVTRIGTISVVLV